jgi:hypothetical protein
LKTLKAGNKIERERERAFWTLSSSTIVSVSILVRNLFEQFLFLKVFIRTRTIGLLTRHRFARGPMLCVITIFGHFDRCSPIVFAIFLKSNVIFLCRNGHIFTMAKKLQNHNTLVLHKFE